MFCFRPPLKLVRIICFRKAVVSINLFWCPLAFFTISLQFPEVLICFCTWHNDPVMWAWKSEPGTRQPSLQLICVRLPPASSLPCARVCPPPSYQLGLLNLGILMVSLRWAQVSCSQSINASYNRSHLSLRFSQPFLMGQSWGCPHLHHPSVSRQAFAEEQNWLCHVHTRHGFR